MAGGGHRGTDASGNRVALDDRFWRDLECSLASAYGWTPEYVYNHLDLPTYVRHCRFWADHPPLYELPSMLLQMLGAATGAPGDSQPQPRTSSPTQAAKFTGNPEAAARVFAQDFVNKAGGQIGRIGANYYDQMCAEMDAARVQMGLRPLNTSGAPQT